MLSIQHQKNLKTDDIKQIVLPEIQKVIPKVEVPRRKHFRKPCGRFEIGGPHGDAGLTGRKIVVDTYGGIIWWRSFSGKDPSKVDRSGAYAARYIIKNIVGAGLAKKCTIQLAYVIGLQIQFQFFGYTLF